MPKEYDLSVYIYNPQTNRFVKRDGRVGKRLIEEQSKIQNKVTEDSECPKVDVKIESPEPKVDVDVKIESPKLVDVGSSIKKEYQVLKENLDLISKLDETECLSLIESITLDEKEEAIKPAPVVKTEKKIEKKKHFDASKLAKSLIKLSIDFKKEDMDEIMCFLNKSETLIHPFWRTTKFPKRLYWKEEVICCPKYEIHLDKSKYYLIASPSCGFNRRMRNIISYPESIKSVPKESAFEQFKSIIFLKYNFVYKEIYDHDDEREYVGLTEDMLCDIQKGNISQNIFHKASVRFQDCGTHEFKKEKIKFLAFGVVRNRNKRCIDAVFIGQNIPRIESQDWFGQLFDGYLDFIKNEVKVIQN